MCDSFGQLSLRPPARWRGGGLAGMGLPPPCTLVMTSYWVTYLVLLQDPNPKALSNIERKRAWVLIWDWMLFLLSRVQWAGALHRSFSQQWLVSSVTLDRYSNLLEPQFLHLYNGDDYCCFVPFSHHTFIKGIFLHVKHWRHLNEIQLAPALSRRYSLDKKECESKCQVPGWASRTGWSGNIWTLNFDIHRLEFQLWY